VLLLDVAALLALLLAVLIAPTCLTIAPGAILVTVAVWDMAVCALS
jgi:hypothetical protein